MTTDSIIETPPSAGQLSDAVSLGIHIGMEAEDRTQQSLQGIIGPSDVGFCRNKAALMIRQVPPSDVKSKWAAAMGTAADDYVSAKLAQSFPQWLFHPRNPDKTKLRATLDNGMVIPGTPDIIIPEWNMLVDLKTKDGLATIRRNGPDQSNRYQRFIYVVAAVQAGILTRDRPLFEGNIFMDRSGHDDEPYVEYGEVMWDLEMVAVCDWLNDVTYAVVQQEDASRDIPAPLCERICEFFSVCRGTLPTSEPVLIEDPVLVDALHSYDEGRTMAKEGEQLKKESKRMLEGVNGSDGELQVRWTYVNPTVIDTYDRNGYDKIDVRKVKNRG